MRPRVALLCCFALLTVTPPGARAALIDSWQVAQQLTTPPQMINQTVSGPGMIGGYRNSSLLANSATDVNPLSIGNGTLTFAVDPAARNNGFYFGTWDGMPPGVGLGGVDVTNGGTTSGFSVGVVEASGGPIVLALVVADANSQVGNVFNVIPGGTQNVNLFLPFSAFIGQSQPVLIDMTRVDKVQLQLQLAPGARVVLGPIQTTAIPEPTGVCLGAVVWVAGVARLHRRAAR